MQHELRNSEARYRRRAAGRLGIPHPRNAGQYQSTRRHLWWLDHGPDGYGRLDDGSLPCGRSVVTVAVSNIAFLQPVQVGDAVCCYTDPVRIGRTSITLNVEVWVLRQGRGTRLKVTEAEFIFVAVNENGRPCPLA